MYLPLPSVLAALALIVPGYLLLSALGLGTLLSLGCAAPVSTFVMALLGYAMDYLSISGPGKLLVLALLLSMAVSLLLRVAFRRGGPPCKPTTGDPRELVIPATYVLMAVGIAIYVFCLHIGDGTAFVQYDDNAAHLGTIKATIDGGSLNCLNSSSYSAVPSQQAPYTTGGLYPGAWYLFAAIAGSISKITTTVAENAANIALTVVVYPLGCCALASKVFSTEDTRSSAIYGASLTWASLAFPTRMLTVHGAFPNLGAFCLIPALMALFIEMLNRLAERIKSNSGSVTGVILAFLAAGVGTACMHPNAILACAVLLMPYLVLEFVPHAIRALSHRGRGWTTVIVVLAQTVTCALFAALWVFLNGLPAFDSVVNFIWDWSPSVEERLSDLVSCSYYFGYRQVALAILVAIGLVASVCKRGQRWVALEYLLACLLFFAGGSDSIEIKKLAIGFWYTDPERIAAILAIASFPVSTLGVASLVNIATWPITRFCPKIKNAFTAFAGTLVVLAASAWAVFLPNAGASLSDGWNDATYLVEDAYNFDFYQTYTQQEVTFVEKAKRIVPEGSLVLNLPFDGSIFSYPLNDLNVYYKSYRSSHETDESKLIRMGLNTIASNEPVRQAVDTTGARYVILLSGDGFVEGKKYTANNGFTYYKPAQWRGFDITDDTPGFEPLLRDGNMALYKITALDSED